MRSKFGQAKRLLVNADLKLPKICMPRSKTLRALEGTYRSEPGRGESPKEFTFSCNPVHIVRAGETRHFISCLSLTDGESSSFLRGYVANPNVAIAFVRNKKSGQFLSRVFANICLYEGREHLLLERIYGDCFPVDLFRDSMLAKGHKTFILTEVSYSAQFYGRVCGIPRVITVSVPIANPYVDSYYLNFLRRDYLVSHCAKETAYEL